MQAKGKKEQSSKLERELARFRQQMFVARQYHEQISKYNSAFLRIMLDCYTSLERIYSMLSERELGVKEFIRAFYK